MNTLLTRFKQQLKKQFGQTIIFSKTESYDIYVSVKKENLLPFIFFLKNNTFTKFEILTDIVAYDCPNKINRFRVIYNLLSVRYNCRLFVEVCTSEIEPLDSVCSLFPAANWLEREVWDMYGVLFKNHPDLRRILTDYGFKGHPLRKDFPLTGFLEVNYDINKKQLRQEPVELALKFRDFKFDYKNNLINTN